MKNKKDEAVAAGTAYGFCNNQPVAASNQANSVLDNATGHDRIQGAVSNQISHKRKIIRCFICLGCGGSYAPNRMSSCLVLCKSCYSELCSKNQQAQKKFVARASARFNSFLRRRIEQGGANANK